MIQVVTQVTNLNWENNFKVDSDDSPSPDHKCPWVEVPAGGSHLYVSLTVTTGDSFKPLVVKLFKDGGKRKFAIYSGRHGDGVTPFRTDPTARRGITLLERDFYAEDVDTRRDLRAELGRSLDMKVVNTGKFNRKDHSVELMAATRADLADGYVVIWAWCHSIFAAPENDIAYMSPLRPNHRIKPSVKSSHLLSKATQKISDLVSNNLLPGVMGTKRSVAAGRVEGRARLEALSGTCECRFNPRNPSAGCVAALGDDSCTVGLAPKCTTTFAKGAFIPACGCQCSASKD